MQAAVSPASPLCCMAALCFLLIFLGTVSRGLFVFFFPREDLCLLLQFALVY